jgi:hypothetical protein
MHWIDYIPCPNLLITLSIGIPSTHPQESITGVRVIGGRRGGMSEGGDEAVGVLSGLRRDVCMDH